jgi:hypothetical protein
MKLTICLSLAVAASAVPLEPEPRSYAAYPPKVYKLKLQSSVFPPLHLNCPVNRAELTPHRSSYPKLTGKYLSIYDGSVGVYKTNGVPVQVYPLPAHPTTTIRPGQDRRRDASASPDPGAVELHTYPIGIVDHALAVTGSASDTLKSLSDVTMPGMGVQPAGQTADYKSFTMAGTGSGANGAKPAGAQVSYSGAPGSWVAIPRDSDNWAVNWYDGTGFMIDAYQKVNVTYEEVGEVSGSNTV